MCEGSPTGLLTVIDNLVKHDSPQDRWCTAGQRRMRPSFPGLHIITSNTLGIVHTESCSKLKTLVCITHDRIPFRRQGWWFWFTNSSSKVLTGHECTPDTLHLPQDNLSGEQWYSVNPGPYTRVGRYTRARGRDDTWVPEANVLQYISGKSSRGTWRTTRTLLHTHTPILFTPAAMVVNYTNSLTFYFRVIGKSVKTKTNIHQYCTAIKVTGLYTTMHYK